MRDGLRAPPLAEQIRSDLNSPCLAMGARFCEGFHDEMALDSGPAGLRVWNVGSPRAFALHAGRDDRLRVSGRRDGRATVFPGRVGLRLVLRVRVAGRCARRGRVVPRRNDALRHALREHADRAAPLRDLRQRLPRGAGVHRGAVRHDGCVRERDGLCELHPARGVRVVRCDAPVRAGERFLHRPRRGCVRERVGLSADRLPRLDNVRPLRDRRGLPFGDVCATRVRWISRLPPDGPSPGL